MKSKEEVKFGDTRKKASKHKVRMKKKTFENKTPRLEIKHGLFSTGNLFAFLFNLLKLLTELKHYSTHFD